MPTKMRLQRHGKKGMPFYHIVIADGRAPRDGRFIEKIGTYNPLPDPADIILNEDKALNWLQKGAQPTDTVRTILSYKGILYKHHLLIGVKKGALTEAEAEARHQTWMKEKEEKIANKRKGLLDQERAERKSRLEAETKINEDRAAEIAKQKAVAIEEKVKEAKEKASETEAEKVEENTEESVTKEAVEAKVEEAKTKVEDKTETKAEAEEKTETETKAEVEETTEVATEEAKVEEKTEAATEEVKTEEKAEEVKEEAKAEAEVEEKVEEKTETEAKAEEVKEEKPEEDNKDKKESK
jgi:small subunit ribosomal protein S16